MTSEISRIVTVTVPVTQCHKLSDKFTRAPVNETTAAKIASSITMLDSIARIQGYATSVQIDDYNSLLEQFVTCKRTMMEAYRRG